MVRRVRVCMVGARGGLGAGMGEGGLGRFYSQDVFTALCVFWRCDKRANKFKAKYPTSDCLIQAEGENK